MNHSQFMSYLTMIQVDEISTASDSCAQVTTRVYHFGTWLADRLTCLSAGREPRPDIDDAVATADAGKEPEAEAAVEGVRGCSGIL